ncbi:MAG: HlyD family efflux transporter periplasmic adaptor subunit [Lachnospiraceae bacterium]|nr:HlyD family efflux transporter periplasmic adaptor subunit [Lachnospiraceae bacterium]
MSIDLENIKKNKKETDPQEVRYRRRKDAIKNFAIVFLVIMLVLTFFSNTIMNYSLPQVAVQYMESGSITTTIRGTGTVESGDPYSVVVKESRTVSSVNCRVGQEVHKGDLLFSMSAEDSTELEAAKDELKAAQDAYDDKLLDISITADIIASSQGNVNITEYRAKITALQKEVENAQKAVDAAADEVSKINDQLAIARSQYISAADRDKLQNLEKAWEAYGYAGDVVADYNAAVNAEKDTASVESSAKSEYESKKSDYESKQSVVDMVQQNVDDLVASGAVDGDPDLDAAKAELATAIADRDAAKTACETADAAYTGAVNAHNNAVNDLNSIKPAYDAFKAYDDFNKSINNRENSQTDNISSLEAQLAAANIKLTQANDTLKEKSDELGEYIGDIGLIRELNDLHDKIAEAQKKVDKLTTASAALDITAPIDGTILSVYVTSGKQTVADSDAVIIQPVGQTFTMSFTVTNDEAKAISIGANATVANSWWYNDVTGYVESIRPDPMSPNTSKKVTLNLSGSLTSGQTLTMSIDSRTSNYDSIVPNSAIHEDNNGKFILIVQSKSSPLGNRYFAVRYDVQVLASDDTKSAVKAGLEGYEYVITTSSKPISAGDQVRLSEN